MNIDIVGRIRPPLPGDVGINLQVTEGKRVHAQQGGNSHRFVFKMLLLLYTLS